MTPAQLKAPILTAMQSLLNPLGFRKKSAVFQRPLAEVVHLLDLQGSSSNEAGLGRFTVNVGVFVPELVYPDVRDVTKPSIAGAHWRLRLGQLSGEDGDLWWQVASLPEAEAAGIDVAKRIEQFALPALQLLADRASLAALWTSGRCPGLTAGQRSDYLGRISARAPAAGR